MSMDDTINSSATWAAFQEGRVGWFDWVEMRLHERLIQERDFGREVLAQIIHDLTDDLEQRIEKAIIELRLAAKVQDGCDGRSFRIRGTFNPRERYKALDVVMLNGASFIAQQDDPGVCPGDNWQLSSQQGKRGFPGEKGEPGRNGRDAARIKSWQIDHTNFVVTPLMDDGNAGPPLYLRELFQAFLDATS
jgi:hypothetical protein